MIRARTGRLAAVALCLALGVAATACSGSSDSSTKPSSSTTTTKPAAPLAPTAAKRWRAVEADPCRLLPAATAAKVLDVAQVLPVKAPTARTCVYGVDKERTIEVQLFQPQASSRWANRSAGARAISGSKLRELTLVGPGVGILVRNGRALALVAVRVKATVWNYDSKVLADATKLGQSVRTRLPVAPGPGPSLARRDLCDLAPASLLGKGTVALDAQDTDACRYQAEDGTTAVFRWTKAPKKGTTTTPAVLSKPWKALSKGATWQANEAGSGGSGLGQVPIDGRVLVISTSSGGRSAAELQKLSASIARSVRAAR